MWDRCLERSLAVIKNGFLENQDRNKTEEKQLKDYCLNFYCVEFAVDGPWEDAWWAVEFTGQSLRKIEENIDFSVIRV